MKIIYTDQAIQNLKVILDYFAHNVSSQKAYQVRDLIFEAADQLIDHPEIGQVESYLEHLEHGHRRIVADTYKIIYRRDLEADAIYITDIFDTRQDPSKMKG